MSEETPTTRIDAMKAAQAAGITIRVIPPKCMAVDELMNEWVQHATQTMFEEKPADFPAPNRECQYATLRTMLSMQRTPNPLRSAEDYQFAKLLPHDHPAYGKAYIKYAQEHPGEHMPANKFLWVAAFVPKSSCSTVEAIYAKLGELNPADEYDKIVANNAEKAPSVTFPAKDLSSA